MFERAERPETMPAPIQWNDMATAPHDGAWMLLDVEDGSTDGSDHAMSCIYVGRWNPKNFPEIGPHFYEWEIIERYPDRQFGCGELTNHTAAGRVHGWLPLPPLTNGE